MKRREALKEAGELLEKAGVPDARVDARLLLAEITGCSPLNLLAQQEEALSSTEQAAFFAWVKRRAGREPLQYILGKAWFMGHPFFTHPQVLIPRQDSEVLCQRALALAPQGARVLDVCCGSGCLGISLKLARPDCEVYLGDLSPQALALSQRNAQALGARVEIRLGDLFSPFAGLCFDLILINPPYIPSGELPGLQQEVRREPALALDGGADGLRVYRAIAEQISPYLNPGGSLLLELGDGQAAAVSALFKEGFSPAIIHRDLGGLPRVLETKRIEGVD